MYFNEPSLSRCKPHRDFGCGFYLAQNYMDALSMAIKNTSAGYVQTYEISNVDGLTVLELNGYSDEWLSFIVRSRLGMRSNYDLVIGNTAGGGINLKSKFSKHRNAGTPADEVAAVMRMELTSTLLGVQYAFLTQRAISRLRYIDSETIEKECFT